MPGLLRTFKILTCFVPCKWGVMHGEHSVPGLTWPLGARCPGASYNIWLGKQHLQPSGPPLF